MPQHECGHAAWRAELARLRNQQLPPPRLEDDHVAGRTCLSLSVTTIVIVCLTSLTTIRMLQGVRGIGFLHSGSPSFIPTAMRGKGWDGMMHGTDWYVTVLGLAGVSAADIRARATGPLPPDGMDILPALLANRGSPRTELVHNIDEESGGAMHVGSIRVGDFKLIKGYPGCSTPGRNAPGNPDTVKGGCYNGVDFAWKPPEMTQPGFDHGVTFRDPAPCSKRPCLFNIKADPTEVRHTAHPTATMLSPWPVV